MMERSMKFVPEYRAAKKKALFSRVRADIFFLPVDDSEAHLLDLPNPPGTRHMSQARFLVGWTATDMPFSQYPSARAHRPQPCPAPNMIGGNSPRSRAHKCGSRMPFTSS